MKTPQDKIMEAVAEADFIMAVDPAAPGPDFNNDPACFMRYCDMQARDMEKKGFLTIAKCIREITKINA